MPEPRESSLTTAVAKRLKDRGAWFLKVHGSRWQRSGVPDYLVLYRGVMLGLELKRPGEKPTLLQEREMMAIRRQGGRTAVIHHAWQVDALLDAVEEIAA